MRLLLDTHILIWAMCSPSLLPKKFVGMIESRKNELLVSMGSLWEIAIKQSLGKLEIDDRIFDTVLLKAHGYAVLPIQIAHLKGLLALPHHHRDPFDRLLIAQALEENLTLVTSDAQLQAYDARLLLA